MDAKGRKDDFTTKHDVALPSLSTYSFLFQVLSLFLGSKSLDDICVFVVKSMSSSLYTTHQPLL